MGTTFSVYCDVADFILNSGANIDTNSLIGLQTSLTTTIAAGVGSFSIVSATGGTGATQAWILDGYNSEMVTGTLSGTTFTLTAGTVTAFTHNAGTSVSSAGPAGCLARTIVSASRMVDQACRQGAMGVLDRTLFAVSRTETHTMATSRAYVDSDGTLTVWPYHFPIQSLTSIGVQIANLPTSNVDTTSIVFPEGQKNISIPFAGFSNTISTRAWYPSITLRNMNEWLTLTYTGGPINGTSLSSVQYDIQQATYYYVMHIMGYKVNPAGAAQITQGGTSREFRLRGDTSGKSLLVLDAESLLLPYMAIKRGGHM